MNYLSRQMEEAILKTEKQFPVIMVCGQRQTGKSTMLRHISSDERTYVSMDDANARMLAKNDPELFFETYPLPIFIDEFQRVPEILLQIKKIVDERIYRGEEINGMFFLSGSQKFVMMKNISETLAGRVAIFNLLPLSQDEMLSSSYGVFDPDIDSLQKKKSKGNTQKEIFTRIFNGGLPKIALNPDVDRELYYSSYMDTYIERDISALQQVGKLDQFRSFVTLMAANTAQELKYDTLAKSVGVSIPTIKEWVSILQRSGIIYLLRPYSSHVTKRLIKSPKCYFLDTGLASYLTRWPTVETLMNGSAAGAYFETFVVSEILKSYYNAGKEPNLYYYRDFEQKEIDLLLIQGDKVYPMEIKKNKLPSSPDKNFDVLAKFGLKVMPGLILCMADQLFPLNRQSWLCPVSLI